MTGRDFHPLICARGITGASSPGCSVPQMPAGSHGQTLVGFWRESARNHPERSEGSRRTTSRRSAAGIYLLVRGSLSAMLPPSAFAPDERLDGRADGDFSGIAPTRYSKSAAAPGLSVTCMRIPRAVSTLPDPNPAPSPAPDSNTKSGPSESMSDWSPTLNL